jgi:hypothetical protein
VSQRTETVETIEMPALGRPGDPCRGCGAPLAADQRYCLNCGTRRGATRLGFKRHLLGDQPTAEAASVGNPATGQPGVVREWTPVIAFAGAVALGFMLMLGVLIGKGGGAKQVAGPAPVIHVDGTGAGADVAATPTDTAKKGKGKSDKGISGANATAADLTSGKKKSVTVDQSALSAINNAKGTDYSKQSAKLPDEIKVAGKPPPKDNKPAAGGGGFQEFK